MVKKVAIIGVGLLGGSLALALKKCRGVKLAGWSPRPSSRKRASRILPMKSTFEEAVLGADVVVLCSPPGAVLGNLRQLLPIAQDDALILDAASVKGELAGGAALIPGMRNHFVPCHPMAGKEKTGSAHADADLYKNRFVFITPMKGNPKDLLGRAKRFWESVGARVLVFPARDHDRRVALTSHLPHLLASALMEQYGRNQGRDALLAKAVATGFRDFTRIAAGSAPMWADILTMNAGEIRKFLKAYRLRLTQLERMLGRGNRGKWLRFFDNARRLREKL